MNKYTITIAALLFCQLLSHAAPGSEDKDPTKYDAYKNFVGQILSSNKTGLTPSFSFTVADKPALEGALPIYPLAGSFRMRDNKGNKTLQEDTNRLIRQRFFAFANGKVGANEGVGELFNGGKWQPEVTVGGSVTILTTRIIRFYKSEINKYAGGIKAMPITQASSVYFSWINLSAGYKMSKFSLYDAKLGPANALIDSAVKGFYASGSFNLYFFPTKNKAPRVTGYLRAGLDFVHHDTNYDDDDVTAVKGTYVTYIPDTAGGFKGGVMQKETKIDAKDVTNFKINYSLNLPIEAIALIHSLDHKFYMGIGGYFNQHLSPGKKATDLGITLNLPITQGKDDPTAVANFQLKFLWQDVGNLNQNEAITTRKDYRKNNFKIGFTASAPILISHRRMKPKKDE